MKEKLIDLFLINTFPFFFWFFILPIMNDFALNISGFFDHEIMLPTAIKVSYHFDDSDVIIWYFFETNYSIYLKTGNCNTFSSFI